MLKPILIFICEKIIQDNSNKISYIDCFDTINTDNFPIKFGPFVVCGQWHKIIPDEFYGYVKVSIIGPKGEKQDVVQDEIIIKNAKHRLNVTFKDGFVFPWEGVYLFKICITKTDKTWEEAYTTDLTVKKNIKK